MAKKTKTAYVCQECGAQHLKWQGQCNQCGTWSSLVEEVTAAPGPKDNGVIPAVANRPLPLEDIRADARPRLVTPDGEMNRVLGGGMVPGAVMLLGGEPGIGKSTLLLQLALQLQEKILYVSGEESAEQIKMRAERLPHANPELLVVAETHLERIFEFIQQVRPAVLIIDSIQTIYTDSLESSPGSVGQVRESAAKLIRVAKQESIPVFLVGHVTKELSLAGPKVLEHAVDAVISFEGDRHLSYRILRSVKNRFGGIELGIYDMRADGLKEVSNPSEIFLSQHDEDHSGVAISATIEGTRPLLVETQALVSPMAYGTPQRSAVGLDNKRLNILLAVLERRSKIRLGTQDIFLNLTGGLHLDDPGLDLAQVVAVVSSLYDYAVARSDVFAAEVGLSSELRPVSRPEQRIAEAEKLGFKRLFMAQSQVSSLRQQPRELELVGASKLADVFGILFGGDA